MATLVLSSIGTALGGPVGGALGSLVGQSIDQQLFGPGIRKGPRLGDLAVQTSSYGSPIPRIYGTMRVAGTVIWATDLRENEAIEGGAKGSPEQLAYRYTASFAVALSSRPVRAVRRIWADGKLLRGEAGDFKVRTGFRFYPGSEDQPVDPLVASIETIDRAPAFRGLSLAVFEDLELAEFGNRIPMLTFEVEADEEAATLADLLRDASGGVIEAANQLAVAGYAAHGRTIADSVAPLIDLCGVELADRGGHLVGHSGDDAAILKLAELGCRIDDEPGSAIERQRAPTSASPSAIAMTYYDPARDYQAGQMRASGGAAGGRDDRIELPAAMSAGQAKSLVEQALARGLRTADRLALRLPPSRLKMGPGDRFELPASSARWIVKEVTVEGLAVVVEAEAMRGSAIEVTADAGRATLEADRPIGRSELALFELPSLGDAPAAAIRVGLALTSGGSWKAVPVEMTLGGQPMPAQAITRRATLGRADTLLRDGSALLIDLVSSVDIQLVNPEQTLRHADQDALMGGANLALIGDELVQFGRAEELEPGRYRLSRLLRGRRGTEWATGLHAAGENFCLVDDPAIRSIEISPAALGASLRAVAHGVADEAPLPETKRELVGEAMRPLAPCHLRVRAETDVLHIGWTSRSHGSFAWNDGAGVSGAGETYRIIIEREQASMTAETTANSLSIPIADLPPGAGSPLTISVAAVGSFATSRDARASIII